MPTETTILGKPGEFPVQVSGGYPVSKEPRDGQDPSWKESSCRRPSGTGLPTIVANYVSIVDTSGIRFKSGV